MLSRATKGFRTSARSKKYRHVSAHAVNLGNPTITDGAARCGGALLAERNSAAWTTIRRSLEIHCGVKSRESYCYCAECCAAGILLPSRSQASKPSAMRPPDWSSHFSGMRFVGAGELSTRIAWRRMSVGSGYRRCRSGPCGREPSVPEKPDSRAAQSRSRGHADNWRNEARGITGFFPRKSFQSGTQAVGSRGKRERLALPGRNRSK